MVDKSDSVSLQSSGLSGPYFLIWIFVGIIPACCGIIVIVLFVSPLRGKIIGLCRSKKSESLESGNDDNKEGLSMTVKGETVYLSLEKSIGKGSFGTVWLAKHSDLTLAVKEMQRHDNGDDSDFKKELEIMSELHSDYIVRVYGSLVTNDLFYIAMEYVPLGSLSSAYKEYMFSTFMRCRFMLDVARGMEYLHDQGIIHRDLKPGNVLVSSLDPKSDVLCKITDFGESRQGLEDTETMTMTRGVGSPYYMAPEMLRGDKKYTRAVDVFSFSILCVEVWNEKLPYSEVQFQTPYTFIMAVSGGSRPEINEGCPKGLLKLISKCWAEDREERPSFTKIVVKLEHLVKTVARDEEDVKPRKNTTETNDGEEMKSNTQHDNETESKQQKENSKEKPKEPKRKKRKTGISHNSQKDSRMNDYAESYVGFVPLSKEEGLEDTSMDDFAESYVSFVPPPGKKEKKSHHKSEKNEASNETPLDDFSTY